MSKVNRAEVHLWGTRIGIVQWNKAREYAEFQYDEVFAQSGIELSPVSMPLSSKVFSFMELDKATFKGLPGMLADSLPDKYGTKLIEEWLVRQGRSLKSFSPVERLCYIGRRGIGALEFFPEKSMTQKINEKIAIDSMVKLASQIISGKKSQSTNIEDENLLAQILMIGTSAGGARAKCLLAYNEITGEIKSGDVDLSEGYTYWLLKLDGVTGNADKEDPDPLGYSRIEYAYYLMAIDCGIEMSQSRLLEEGRRSHFMTKRFDRVPDGGKLHMQSLCAIAHYDFNYARAHSYEQAIDVINKIVDNSKKNNAREQMFLRAIFNVVGRNQDDHTKNIAFLMDRKGVWRLSPAFDMTYAYNPDGEWTSSHQMLINGKSNDINRDDLIALAKFSNIKKHKANILIDKVVSTFTCWEEFAGKARVESSYICSIKLNLKIKI